MNGIERIEAERQRQISVEGWTSEHDDSWDKGQLAKAAAAYAYPNEVLAISELQLDIRKRLWPWHRRWWKPIPDDRIRELVKAGALIAAEIDRLLRQQGGTFPCEESG